MRRRVGGPVAAWRPSYHTHPHPQQELVSGPREPITPFITKLPALAAMGVSCVLVIGGSGQYFSVAGG